MTSILRREPILYRIPVMFLFPLCVSLSLLLFGDTQSLPASSSLSYSISSSISSSTGQYSELAHLPHKNCSGTVDGETILNCKVEFPGDGKWIPYTFKWTKLGAEKPLFFRFPGYPPHLEASYENRVRMTNPANVRMWNLTTADEGWYQCLITYMNRVPEDMPSPNGTWVYISILSKPKLNSFSEPEMILKEGDHLSLFCKATGTPKPEISWFRDGFPIEAGNNGDSSAGSGRVHVEGDSLLIYHVLRRDAGVYVCRASNSVGEDSRSFKVVLQGGVFIMTVPMNVTVREGRRVQLNCGAEARPDNITYKWTIRDADLDRVGTDVTNVDGLSARISVTEDEGTLVISSAFGGDSGWYYCSATNGLSSATAKAFLNVTFPPKLLHMPKFLYLPRNNPAEIKCRADANPPVSHVNWMKDGKPLRSVSPALMLREERNNNYNNDINSVINAYNAKASRQRMNNHNDVIAGKYSPYVPSSSSYTFVNNGLSIYLPRASSDHHEGTYSCTPFNSLGPGVESEQMRVRVRDPPRFLIRPRRFEQKMLKDSVTFRCDAEGDPKPTIEWRRVGGESLSPKRTTVWEGNLTVNHLVLRDAGQYQCTASNVVTHISATTSLIIEVETPHAPYNISVTTRHFDATVCWLPAFNSGLSLKYVLWYKRLGRDKVNWETVGIHPEDATSFRIGDLLPDSIYEFTVLSQTSSGDDLFSKVIRVRTKALDDFNRKKKGFYDEFEFDGVVVPSLRRSFSRPPPPRHLRVSSPSLENAVNVSFSPPLNSSVDVSFYLIHYRSKDSIGWQEGRVPLWTTVSGPLTDGRFWYVVKQLRPGRRYDFRVVAFSRFHAFSTPSAVVTYLSPSMRAPVADSSVVLSTAAMAGLAGGVAFLVVTIVLSVLAVHVVHKQALEDKYEREKKKFLAVKYTDARNTNGHCKMNAYTRAGSRAHV